MPRRPSKPTRGRSAPLILAAPTRNRTLRPSCVASRVSGGDSETACLLRAGPAPQQAAASTSLAASGAAIDLATETPREVDDAVVTLRTRAGLGTVRRPPELTRAASPQACGWRTDSLRGVDGRADAPNSPAIVR